ncbi:MAG TPA: LysM domain-containing protein [Rhizomicrobium sp.]|jgi:nucleoid-associated protein YgaU|nr:LysM domain-containing protein [Rhizomicrobium sp.]
MRKASRYPLSVESAAPGKLVRTRTRAVPNGPPASGNMARDKAAFSYLGRTLLPLPSTLKAQSSYTIQAGDRLDNISTRLLGDPLLYWMLLEANGVSDPATLCAIPGRKITVPAAVGQGSNPFGEPLAGRRSTAAAPASHSDDSEENP